MKVSYKKLEDVCEVIDPHPSHRAPEIVPDGIPFVGIGDFNLKGKIDVSKARRVSSQIYVEHKERYSLHDELLAIGRVASIGKVVYLEKLEEIYTISPTLAVLKPYAIDKNYLFYALQSPAYKEQLDQLSTGSTRRSVGMKNLRISKIPIVSDSQQKRIVAILDEVSTGIDQAIANTEKNLASAREIFDSYLGSIFSQKGDGWVDKQLSSLCKNITVGHVGSMAKKYKESGIPFLRSQNIRAFEISLKNVVFIDEDFDASLKKSRLYPGDVAIVRTGYPGTAAVIPPELTHANCSDLVIVRPGEAIDAEFLAAFFNSTFGKELVLGKIVGAAQKHFNVTAAKNVMLHVPPLSEQKKIVQKIAAVRRESQKLEDIYVKKIYLLNKFKQSILQKAFNGELTADLNKLAEAAE